MLSRFPKSPLFPYLSRRVVFAAVCATSFAGASRAQTVSGRVEETQPVLAGGSTLAQKDSLADQLPDAPGAVKAEGESSSAEHASFSGTGSSMLSGFAMGGQVTPNADGRYSKTVLPGHTAARLSVHDKVILGIKENLSPISLAGWAISAGYEQGTNGSPNYGQTGKGFAQRLGAAAARGSSENIFQDSVLSAVLHEDPRYYKLGSGHRFLARAAYAVTRPIIGKTDGGRRTINFADLGGDLAGAALTQAYYPPLNRGTTEVLKTFGGSVGGDAIGFAVSEFLSDALHGLHLTKSRE